MAGTKDPEDLTTQPVGAEQQEDSASPSAPEPSPEDIGVAKAVNLDKGEVDAFVEGWWRVHFPNSAVARYTDAWNAAHAAKEDLKRRLKHG